MTAARIASLVLVASQAAFAEVVVFQNARIIDGTGAPPRENATLVIDGGRIVAIGAANVPPNARVIDARGKTIMPGLVNAHGHVGVTANGEQRADAFTRENVTAQLQTYEQFGVTTVLTLGLNRDLIYELRDEQRKGSLGGASIFTAGRGIGEPDGAPPLKVAPDQVYRPKTPDEAVADVREAAAHHPEFLKLWVDDIFGKMPKLPQPVFQAAIAEAHRDGMKVASHIFYLEDAKAVVEAGVDALGHSVRDRPVDDQLVQAMKNRGTWYVATLHVDDSLPMFVEDPALLEDPFLASALGPEVTAKFRSPEFRQKLAGDANLQRFKDARANAMKNLVALQRAGANIAFGTDSGGNPLRIQGWGEHRELELMVRAGLSPMQAIVAATRGSAMMLGANDRGTLQKGKRADFLVLGANPLENIRNTRQLVAIWHGGREVKPKAVLASAK